MKTRWGIFYKETNELVMHQWSQSYVSRGCVYLSEASAKRGLRGITGGQSDKYYVAEFKPSFIVKIDPMELEFQPLKGQVQYSDEELRDTSADWFPREVYDDEVIEPVVYTGKTEDLEVMETVDEWFDKK